METEHQAELKDQPEQTGAAPSVTETSHNHLSSNSNKKRILIIAGVGLVVVIAAVASLMLASKSKDNKKTSLATTNNTLTKQTKAEPQKQLDEVSGITWLAAPKKLADQKFFTNIENWHYAGESPDSSYYQVGTTKDQGQVILVTIPPDGPGTT